jgi:hypothetical protein
MPYLTVRDTNVAGNVSTNILFLKGQIVYLNLPVTIIYYLLMLRTAANSMPANPSPKDVIFITAGRRPAAKDPNILLLPERQDGFRIDSDVLPDQAANRRLPYLPQAALCLHAVMKITPFGRAVLPVSGAVDA